MKRKVIGVVFGSIILAFGIAYIRYLLTPEYADPNDYDDDMLTEDDFEDWDSEIADDF